MSGALRDIMAKETGCCGWGSAPQHPSMSPVGSRWVGASQVGVYLLQKAPVLRAHSRVIQWLGSVPHALRAGPVEAGGQTARPFAATLGLESRKVAGLLNPLCQGQPPAGVGGGRWVWHALEVVGICVDAPHGAVPGSLSVDVAPGWPKVSSAPSTLFHANIPSWRGEFQFLNRELCLEDTLREAMNVPVNPPSPQMGSAEGPWVLAQLERLVLRTLAHLHGVPPGPEPGFEVKRPGEDRPEAEKVPESGDALCGPLLASQQH
ncbi:hypothetical protein P7K49_002050 [Saguinus oedipus]|uniref:Uncharacterized protein n=1 Tax=Saguinus oedipus TaxID=9490 RepID=A0ABQ9WGA8_SAGOE|nr:hypothetical protein P7K49_002050 [Saguinus oedipus]